MCRPRVPIHPHSARDTGRSSVQEGEVPRWQSSIQCPGCTRNASDQRHERRQGCCPMRLQPHGWERSTGAGSLGQVGGLQQGVSAATCRGDMSDHQDQWWWVSTRHFTVGIRISSDGVVTDTAPLLRRFVGQSKYNLWRWLKRQPGLVVAPMPRVEVSC